MDKKWSFAAKHSGRSAAGIARLMATRPGFGATILNRRLNYFLRRRVGPPFTTPDRFHIDTPDTLIAYWSMFVERELHHESWVEALRHVEKPLVVDVGANAGVFSHYVFSVAPQAEFIAFEPLPTMAKRVRNLAERTGMKMTCIEKAVSKQPGQALFESPHGYDGISRLATDPSAANTFTVETTTLDQELKGRHVHLMKIDVEGFEMDVLAGGASVLANTDFIVIESEERGHLQQITQALGDKFHRTQLAATDYLFARR
jgi:FkbM family methyltransferase